MRFYFDLTDDHTVIPDSKGAEAADLSEAIDQARIVIEELRGSGELFGVEGSWHLIIRETVGGRERHRIPILASR